MKPTCFFIMFILIFPCCLLFAEEETEEDTLTRLSKAFFGRFNTKHIAKTPKLFHFPPTSLPEIKAKDTKYISAGMRVFLREFGNISNERQVYYQEPSQDFRIGAGTDEYWQNHPDFERWIFKVSFSKAGEGYIRFDFCKITAKWQIGFVRFALPVINAQADQIFSDIGKIIWELKEE